METFVQPGETLSLTAPSGSPGGVVSGEPYLMGSLLVIAAETKDAGESFRGQVEGVHLGAKVATEAWTEGQIVRWNDTLRKFTEVTGSPVNPIVGSAAEAVEAAVGLATNATDGSPDSIVVADNVLTINDYSTVTGKTVTVTLARDGQSPLVTVLTEGVDFDAETDNATTATNIAAAIDALPGVAAVASQAAGSPPSEIVTVTADNPVRGKVRLDGVAR